MRGVGPNKKNRNSTKEKPNSALDTSAEGANISSSGNFLSSPTAMSRTEAEAGAARLSSPPERLGYLLLDWLEALGYRRETAPKAPSPLPEEDLHFSEKRLREIQQRLAKFKVANLRTRREPGELCIDNVELMALLHISPRTSRSWREKGYISYSRVGRKIYFRLSEVEAMLDSYQVQRKQARPP